MPLRIGPSSPQPHHQKISKWSGILSAVVVTFFWALSARTPAVAVTEIYLRIPGVPGEAVSVGHEGWNQISSCSSTVVSAAPAGASLGFFNLLKPTDKGTPALYQLVCAGSVIPRVQLDFINITNTAVLFYSVTLSNSVVTSMQTSGSPGAIVEAMALSYEKIAWSYLQVNRYGQPILTNTATWSIPDSTGTYNSQPASTDTDGDGMPDYYELAHGLNPNVNDAAGDPDHDGLTNYQEYLAGTDPQNFDSVFRVTKINLANGLVRVTWTSVAGKTYTVHAASSVEGPYAPVQSVPSAGNGETFADFPASVANQFFRISTP